MRIPGLIHADAIAKGNWPQAGLPDGRWVASRPLPYFGIFERWRLAWLVFTGRADALVWTEQYDASLGEA